MDWSLIRAYLGQPFCRCQRLWQRLLAACLAISFTWPISCPAPLVYKPGEGWVYENEKTGKDAWMKTRAADQVRLASDAYTKHDFKLALKAAQRTVQVWPLSEYAPEAQYLLSRLYATGHGAAKDVEQAELCLAAAERGGNLAAQMARSAARQGVLDNPESAFKSVRQKAAEGEVKSQLLEGILYALGEGIPKDLNAARKSLQKAAQQEDHQAQYFLGRLFLVGDKETRPDREMGLRWLTQAASQGHAPAQEILGELSTAAAESESWFLKAAEQGSSRAQEKLGLLYALQSEGSTNKVSACLWLSLAADAGHSTARAWLQRLVQELSPAQTTEFTRLRLEFKARHRTEERLQNGEAQTPAGTVQNGPH